MPAAKPAMQLGNFSTGHPPCFPPTPLISGSLNVFVGTRPATKVGDKYVPHGCVIGDNFIGHPVRLAATGSLTVLVNNLPMHRTADAISCGDFAGIGFPKVLVGG